MYTKQATVIIQLHAIYVNLKHFFRVKKFDRKSEETKRSFYNIIY